MIVQIEFRDIGNIKHVEQWSGVGTIAISPDGCVARLIANAAGALKLKEQHSELMMLIPRAKIATGRHLTTLP